MINNKLTDLIIKARLDSGLSQAEIAKKLSVTPQFVWLAENNRCRIPNAFIFKLSKVTKLNLISVKKIMLDEFKNQLDNDFSE